MAEKFVPKFELAVVVMPDLEQTKEQALLAGMEESMNHGTSLDPRYKTLQMLVLKCCIYARVV